MCNYKVKRLVCNLIEENTYVLWDATTREAAVIDCGAWNEAEQQQLADLIEAERLRPVLSLLTHAHFDHIFGLQFLYDTYGLRPRMHSAEHANYEMASRQTEIFLHRSISLATPPAGDDLSDGERITLGSLTLEVIPTPGHTAGGVCFYLADDEPAKGLLFSGDTLFRQSVGRTDLPGGSTHALTQSIVTRLFPLPAPTHVLPGHGETTTIGDERGMSIF